MPEGEYVVIHVLGSLMALLNSRSDCQVKGCPQETSFSVHGMTINGDVDGEQKL